MRTNRYLLSAIALGAMLTSCQKENLEGGKGEVNGDARKVTISANASTDQTRTSINDLDVKWTNTDKLGVFTATSGVAKEFSNLLAEPNASADFTGELAVSEGAYAYAFYPFGSYVANSGTTATFTLPATQVQKQGEGDATDFTSIGAYAFMYGKSATGMNASGGFSMPFQHLMTFIDFKLSNIPTTAKILSLVLRANAAPLFATTANVDIESNSVVLTGSANEIRVDVKNSEGVAGVATNGSLTVSLAMLPQEVAVTHNWSIDIYTEEEAGIVLTKTINKSITTTANTELGAGKRSSIALDYKKTMGISYEVKIGDFTLADRNAGSEVPVEGPALNFTNFSALEGNKNKAFRGGNYIWANAANACVEYGTRHGNDNWRLPTKAELMLIVARLELAEGEAYLIGDNGKKCYIPLSGLGAGDYATYARGYYWSSETQDANNAWAMVIYDNDPSNTTADYYNLKTWDFSVRCVLPDPSNSQSSRAAIDELGSNNSSQGGGWQ